MHVALWSINSCREDSTVQKWTNNHNLTKGHPCSSKYLYRDQIFLAPTDQQDRLQSKATEPTCQICCIYHH